MDLKRLSAEYSHIYNEADKLFKKHNPCQFKNGQCISNRTPPQLHSPQNGCCGGCKRLGSNGCKVKSLGCKLFACSNIKRRSKECFEKIMQLRIQARETLGLFSLDCYMPKYIFMERERKWNEKGRGIRNELKKNIIGV